MPEKVNPKEFEYGGTMEYTKNESIMFFGSQNAKGKSYRSFYGIGVVYRIVKQEKQDLVYINFGILKHHRPRLVVVNDNHSRRQLLTLKRGQVCQVYGMSKIVDYGEKKKLWLLAKGLLGWYVPTLLDIKKMPPNEDFSTPSESEIENEKKFGDILNEFMNVGEE